MSSFPNSPLPDQEWTHQNGITYIYNDSLKAWEIKYQAATNTASLPLANPTGTYLLTGGATLPDTGGLITQSHYNEWAFNSLVKVDATSRVDSGEAAPPDADTNQLWYKPSTGSLYVYYNDNTSTQWVEIGGAAGGLDDAPIDGTLYGRQDGAWTEVPDGGGGEESQPFIKWHQFAVIERSSRFDYDPIWEVNANSSNNDWEYQIDLQGNGTWQEVSGLGEPFHTQIGWYGSMSSSHLRLNKVDSQNNLYPNAKIRFFVTTELNGVTNTDYSCELPAWTAGECDYSSAVAELSQRVSQGEEIQSEVLSSIQQIQVQAGLHQLNLDNINADQVTQNQDIESLQNQVNELEIVKGALATYDCFATSLPYNARPGECMFNDTTASAVIVLGFGVENKDGVLTKSMEDGDIIEVIAPGGVVSRYTIVDATSAPQMVAVSFVSGEQTFGIGTEYSVYIYPQNAAGVSKEYVDDQDNLKLNKSGGLLTGDVVHGGTANQIMTNNSYIRFGWGDVTTAEEYGGYIFQRDSTTFELGAYNGVTLKFHGEPVFDTSPEVPTPTEELHAANKYYVDNQIGSLPSVNLDNYLGKTGNQDLNSAEWKLRQPNQDGNNRSFITIHDGEMNLYHVADPTGRDDAWAANKGYVDAQIAAIPNVNLNNYLPLSGGSMTGRIDLTMPDPGSAAIRTIGSIAVKADGAAALGDANNFLANKDYVRVYSTPVAGADVANKSYTDSTFVKKTRRPGLVFAYESGASGVPASGKFRWYIDGGRRLRLSATTKDGIPWAVDTPIADINFNEGHMFSIWATVSGTSNWRLKQTGTIHRIDYHANDVLVYISYHAENGSFSTSAEYNVTIAGLI